MDSDDEAPIDEAPTDEAPTVDRVETVGAESATPADDNSPPGSPNSCSDSVGGDTFPADADGSLTTNTDPALSCDFDEANANVAGGGF